MLDKLINTSNINSSDESNRHDSIISNNSNQITLNCSIPRLLVWSTRYAKFDARRSVSILLGGTSFSSTCAGADSIAYLIKI
jgi:hypothetical protein